MTTWVFLRGLTRESRHWGHFPEIFQAQFPDARVHTLDLPGNGALNGQRSPVAVAAMAESCRAQLLEAGAPPPYHVLAMSLGAMAAVAWAHRHPEELRGCILINTSLRPFSPFYRRLRPGSYWSLAKLLLPGSTPASRESVILGLTSRRAEAPAQVLEDWIACRRQHPVSSGNALRQLLAALRFRAPLAPPSVPLLVLASRRDGLVDPRCSRELARIWNTGFAEHPSAGHDLPLDDGPWVARQVKAWLPAQAQGQSLAAESGRSAPGR